MKTKLIVMLCIVASSLFSAKLSSQNFSEHYFTSFENPSDADGWFFTSTAATISVANSQLIIDSPHEDYFQILTPLGAIQGDFSYKISVGEDAEVQLGFMGIAGFKSVLGLMGDETGISVVYTYDIGSYTEPQLTELFSIPDPATDINTIAIETMQIGNDLMVYLFINDELYQSGTIESVEPDLLYGQLVLGFGAEDDDPIYLPISEVDIYYTPFNTNKEFFADTFDNTNSPWFRFGDYDDLAESLFINNGKLNFLYSGDPDSQLMALSPIGAVGDFSIDIDAGGTDMNGTGSFGRIFDSKHYITVWYEDDEVYLGYANGSPEPQVISNTTTDMDNVTNIKFSVSQTGNDLTLSVFHNNQFILDGTISNAPARLLTGQIAVGYELASELNVWFDEVRLQYDKLIVNTNEKPEDFLKLIVSQNVPNPCSDYTNIRIESAFQTFGNFILLNAGGQTVYTEKIDLQKDTPYTIRLNTKQFKNGIYFYQIQTSEGAIDQCRKLVIMH
ncbi:MAG: T9SS type A sorting domain-containing protein [Bacteroidetes bacterium]|jgi:hypothetical protein|nr:T9SS type A sorting domain-containing protein [Bacteroidota bacterium]